MKKAESAARPKSLSIDAETHDDGVAVVGYPEAEAVAIFGTYVDGDWLDEMTIDVSTYTYIEIPAVEGGS